MKRRIFLTASIIALILSTPFFSVEAEAASGETTPTSYYMIHYNWDNDEGQVPVKWGGQMFKDMSANTHDLAQLSSALCASAGNSDRDGDKRKQDYYISLAYKKLGMDGNAVLYNYPNDTKDIKHKVVGNKKEHCFAIGYKDFKIDGRTTHVIVITMRGTESTLEQVNDWGALPVQKFRNYTVYDYWYIYADRVMDELSSFVDDNPALKKGDVRILIGGHSLGGGAANLVGAALDYDCAAGDNDSWKLKTSPAFENPLKKEDVQVFTFGGLNVFEKALPDLGKKTSDKDYPAAAMFDNICNMFNHWDTFGPNGEGISGYKPGNGGQGIDRKFGKMCTFSEDLDFRNLFMEGDDAYKNHNMQGYTKGIYDGEDKLKGIDEPMSGKKITTVPASSLPSVKTLNDFLKHFASYRSSEKDGKLEREYDHKNATKTEISMMSNLFGDYKGEGPCIDYKKYPKEKQQPEIVEDTTDPYEWVVDPETGGMDKYQKYKKMTYARYNQAQVNWILMNIFNVPYRDERSMAKKSEKNKEFYSSSSTYFNRHYYKPYGSIKSDISKVQQPKYHKVLTDNKGHYCIKYSYGGSGDVYYAVMELKNIDGKSYWSMYSHSKKPPENLKEYFENQTDVDYSAYTYIEKDWKRKVVLVLDMSGSMEGDPLEETKDAARAFVNQMNTIDAEVGIVVYSDSAEVLSDFTRDQNTLIEAINSMEAWGSTNMEDGLYQADTMLSMGNADKKIIVLMSDGQPNVGLVDEDLIAYADEIKNEGDYIYTLGFFSGLDDMWYAQYLMERIATTGFHYEVNYAGNLQAFFEDLGEQIKGAKYMHISVACPVDVTVTNGKETLSSSGEEYNDRTEFGSLSFESNEAGDEKKILRLREGDSYDIRISGYDVGYMDYDIQFMDDEGQYDDTRTFSGLEINENTVIDTVADVSSKTRLKVDNNGDGHYDTIYAAGKNGYGEIEKNYWPIIIAILCVLTVAIVVVYANRRRLMHVMGIRRGRRPVRRRRKP